MNVTLYTFAKRPDSTKRPSQGGHMLSATLKDSTSLLSPVLLFALSGNPTSYNYAYIPDFGRYYYINDWKAIAGMWEASCKVDVLASWKDSIGASTQYVLRAEAESDDNILDSMYPTAGGSKQIKNAEARGYDGLSYIVGVYGDSGANIGGLTYIALTQQQMPTFMGVIFGSDYWKEFDGWDSLGLGVMQFVFNPAQYIASIMAFPFGYPGETKSVNIKLGWFSQSITAIPVTTRVGYYTPLYQRIPKHPSGRKWSNLAPYSNYKVWFPPFGLVQLDSTKLYDADYIIGEIAVDYVTGTCTGILSAVVVDGTTSTKIQIDMLKSQIGIPVEIIANQGKPAELVADVGKLGSDIKAGNAFSVVADIASTTGAIFERGGAHQLHGDFSDYATPPFIVNNYMTIVEEDPNGRGRPLCKNRVISGLPGFIQVSDAKVSFDCTPAETTEIISYMEGGFHYE